MKEIEQRIIEILKKNTTVTTMLGYTFFDIDAFAKILESEALRAEQGEKGETENSVFLIHKDGNTTMLYKNGVIVSPEKFTEFYGCEMTDEQKKLLKIAKENYFKPVEQSKLSAEEVLKNHSELFDEDPFESMYYKDKNAILTCMKAYHSQFEGKELPEEELRKELVKFATPYHADEETAIHNVNNYLKNR